MLKVCFSGDVSFTGFFSNKLNKVDHLFSPIIIDFLNDNNYNVFNIEGPLTTLPPVKRSGISLYSHPKVINILRELKCNIFNLSNNHIMDCGASGLKETVELANVNGILTFGAGKEIDEASTPLIIKNGDIKVALLGICHQEGILAKKNKAGVHSDRDEKLIKHRIEDAKKECDWTVVNYHGGEEYTLFPMPKRRKKFLRYLHYGADIIIAHHSHVIQGYEILDNKCIFYSLGNFIFDIEPHYPHEGSNESVLLKINFEKKNFTVDRIFTVIDRKKECIGFTKNNYRFAELDVSNYYRDWGRNAFFILTKKGKTAEEQIRTDKEQERRNSLMGYLIKLKNFLSLIKAAKGKNSRPLLFGAINYILRKKIGIW